MGNITGKIEKVIQSSGTSRIGKPYERWVFTIDGKDYSTFDELIGKKFKAGQVVVMTGQQRGKFWNMDSMDLADDKTITESERIKEQMSLTDKLLTQILAELRLKK